MDYNEVQAAQAKWSAVTMSFVAVAVVACVAIMASCSRDVAVESSPSGGPTFKRRHVGPPVPPEAETAPAESVK